MLQNEKNDFTILQEQIIICPNKYLNFEAHKMKLDELKKEFAAVADKYGVEKAYLFGSYARGQAKPASDIDICIQKGKIRSLLDLSGFYLDLEERLGTNIDVVTTDGISGEFKRNIEKEFVKIYGN